MCEIFSAWLSSVQAAAFLNKSKSGSASDVVAVVFVIYIGLASVVVAGANNDGDKQR